MVSAGPDHTCIIDETGTVWCWGANNLGQLGNGTHDPSTTPTPVSLPQKAIWIATSLQRTCAVTEDHTLWCWGWDNGTMLPWTATDPTTPLLIEGLPPVLMAISATSHICAISVSNRLWCWGLLAGGYLGTGTTEGSIEPVELTMPTNVQLLSGRHHHTCALETNGTLWCWGANVAGELGNGRIVDEATPQRVR